MAGSGAFPSPIAHAARLEINDDQDSSLRRLQKRNAAIAAIKRTPEYLEAMMQDMTAVDGVDRRPQTPDPRDLTVGKKQWERSVQQWRDGLRGLCPARRYRNVCLVHAFRRLGFAVPYTCDGPFWLYKDCLL